MRRLMLVLAAAVIWGSALGAPALAQDHGTIAFMRPSADPDGYDLWAVHPDGSALRRLTTAPPGTQDYNPAWSPDGKRVLFERRTTPDDGDDLYVVNGDGSGLRRIADCDDLECWGFNE